MRGRKILITVLITVFIGIVIATAALTELQAKSRPNPVDSSSALTSSYNDLGFKVFKQLATEQTGNTIYSPTSANLVFSMLLTGARGDTRQQLQQLWGNYSSKQIRQQAAQILASSQITNGNFQLHIDNSAWLQKGFSIKTAFHKNMQQSYHASINNVDFAKSYETQKTINKYIDNQTNGLINHFLSEPLSPQTALALVSTVHFHGLWQHNFARTNLAPFYLTPEKRELVKMMHQNSDFAYLAQNHLQIVAMAYKDSPIRMWIILPDRKQGPSINQLVKQLDAKTVASWTSKLKTTHLRLSLPKFSFHTQLDLIPSLKALGAGDVFNKNKANLTGISQGSGLYVGALLQQAVIHVNEKGTEAAATTLAGVNVLAARIRPIHVTAFNADHPFIFMLRNKNTGDILFIGKLVKPRFD